MVLDRRVRPAASACATTIARLCTTLCAVTIAVSAAAQGTAPVADPPLVIARRCADELDLMRVARGVGDDKVAALLARGTQAIDAAGIHAEQLPRNRRCHMAYLRGDLLRRAAAVLPPDNNNRAQYLEQSIDVFRRLRVEYIDLNVGKLGYIGEARSQRMAGDLNAASDALQPLLDAPYRAGDKAETDLRRLALLEQLEIELEQSPIQAIEHADALIKRREFRDQPAWMGHVNWAKARGATTSAMAAFRQSSHGQAPDVAISQAVALLTDESVTAIAPVFDRLQLLAELDDLAGGAAMDSQQRIEWARTLAATGHLDQAATAYQRGMARSTAPLATSTLLDYATVLWQQGDLPPAAEVFGDALAQLDDDERRTEVLQWRAACLISAVKDAQDAAVQAQLRSKAIAAVWAVVQSDAPHEARQAALRQWVAFSGTETGPAERCEVLQQNRDLIEQDPHLLYALAASRWEASQGELPETEARQVCAHLRDVTTQAQHAASDELAAHAALLRAHILSGPSLNDTEQALAVLRRHRDLLSNESQTQGGADELRVHLQLALGLIDEAEQSLSAMGAETPLSPRLPLQTGEALARRYATSDASGRVRLRSRIVRLMTQAISLAVDSGHYASVAQRAVRTLLDVEAHADAEAILNRLQASVEPGDDAEAAVALALMRAEAMGGRGQAGRALESLEKLAGQYPNSAPAHLALGQCQMDLEQYDSALGSLRKARQFSRPGGETWWQATLAVTRTLQSTGKTTAAYDVLRVANAVYPIRGNPVRQAEVKHLLGDLKPSGNTTNKGQM